MLNNRNWQDLVDDREIVIYGTGINASHAAKEVEIFFFGGVSFFISRDWLETPMFMGKNVYGKEVLNKFKHYVLIGTSQYYNEVKNELIQIGFEENKDFSVPESIKYMATGMFEDRLVNGVLVGKRSGFPECFLNRDYIQSIGRFTSINVTAQVDIDHTMKMITTSNRLEPVLSEDKAKLLNEKYAENLISNNRLKIGNDVWIGANVFINGSKVKKISDGAIVGSNAVVLEDVPPYAIVVGVPGKLKKYRFTPEQIECLLKVKWWDWTDEVINENAELLYNPDMFFERFM